MRWRGARWRCMRSRPDSTIGSAPRMAMPTQPTPIPMSCRRRGLRSALSSAPLSPRHCAQRPTPPHCEACAAPAALIAACRSRRPTLRQPPPPSRAAACRRTRRRASIVAVARRWAALRRRESTPTHRTSSGGRPRGLELASPARVVARGRGKPRQHLGERPVHTCSYMPMRLKAIRCVHVNRSFPSSTEARGHEDVPGSQSRGPRRALRLSPGYLATVALRYVGIPSACTPGARTA